MHVLDELHGITRLVLLLNACEELLSVRADLSACS